MWSEEIASQARHDDDLLLKLNAFSRSLSCELYKVSEERREEIALKAKMKEQSHLAKKVGCSDRKTKEGIFKFCANFSRARCYRDSSVSCAACFEKKKDSATFCSRCQLLLCSECVKDKFGKCCGCPNIFCSDCAHKEDYFQCYHASGNDREECGNWFCSDHNDDCKMSRTCYECDEYEEMCDICYDGGEYCYDCRLD